MQIAMSDCRHMGGQLMLNGWMEVGPGEHGGRKRLWVGVRSPLNTNPGSRESGKRMSGIEQW